MQFTDPTLIPSLLTAVVAALVATYLFRLWHRQQVKMYTDLPIMFCLCFIGTTANMLIHAIPILLQLEQTLFLFRIRSFAIGLSVIPMMGMVLNIWLSKYEKWHIRSLIAVVGYWFVVVFLGTTEELIILLTVPILLAFTLGLTATFVITWKTQRLQEVRSDLLVVALILAFLSQALKVPLMAAGLDPFVYLLTTAMMIMVGLALVNPWYKTVQKKSPEAVEVAAY